jgi:endonuclease III
MAAKKSVADASKAPAKKSARKTTKKPPARKTTKKPPARKTTKKPPAKKSASSTARTRSAGKAGQRKAVKRLGAPDAQELAARLAVAIPEPRHELSFRTPFELLIATILAAQSTDRTVNQVMPTLLARYPGARELAEAPEEDVEVLVQRTGFFRNKARSIRETSQRLVAAHGGEVPKTMDELTKLQGVARKTANVVLGTAYGIQAGFIVDTHVSRVTQRLGLTRQSDPVRIEAELCRTFEQSSWTDLGHRLTLHGRYTCTAKQPLCSDCPINELCGSRESEPADVWQARAEREGARVDEGIRMSQGA